MSDDKKPPLHFGEAALGGTYVSLNQNDALLWARKYWLPF